MRFFISKRKIFNGEEVDIKATNSYIEYEHPLDRDTACITYIIPRNENSVWVANCFERTFDELVNNLDENTFETIAQTWPTLARLLANGMKNRYQEGALVVFEDSDYCENKWFVASVVGNISFESPEHLFEERLQEAIALVTSSSMTLWIALNENKPNMLREFGKGFLKGVGLAVTATMFAFLGIDSE